MKNNFIGKKKSYRSFLLFSSYRVFGRKNGWMGFLCFFPFDFSSLEKKDMGDFRSRKI